MVGQETKLFLAFLQFCFRLLSLESLGPFPQGAANGRSQPHQVLLQDIIGRSMFQALDGVLLAHGSGDEDERGSGTDLFCGLKRGQAVEGRQRKIGENHVPGLVPHVCRRIRPECEPRVISQFRPDSRSSSCTSSTSRGVVFQVEHPDDAGFFKLGRQSSDCICRLL